MRIEELRQNEVKNVEKIESLTDKVKILTNEKLSLQKIVME